MKNNLSDQAMRKTGVASAALLIAVLAAGCDTDTRGELADAESTGTMNENIETVEPMKDDAIRRAEVTSSQGTAEGEYSGHPEMEMNNSQTESNSELADTQYAAVSFPANSTDLSDNAKDALAGITGALDASQPVSVTVQVAQPKATPDEPLNEEAHTRAENVKAYLEDQGLQIERWTLLDKTPTQPVEDPNQGDAQHLFLYIVVQSGQISSNTGEL